MKKKNKTELLLSLGALVLVYALVTILELVMSPGSILFTVLKKAAIYSLVGVSMNLLNGFTGLFSLGQAGFMLIGAYTYAVLTMPVSVKLSKSVFVYFDCIVKFDVGILPGLLCAGIAAAVFAALIGFPVLRLKSDYLAIATLGFAEIIRALFQWSGLGPLTNGANPLRSYLDLTDTVIPPTLFVFLVAGVCIAVIILLINSSYGRAFKAIRDDEVAAEAMGINLFHHKELSFVISSFFAGVSGALLAMYQYTVQANAFTSAMTYEILLIVVIGGIGSISGTCIASFLYIAASEWWLRGLDMGTFLGISAPGIFRSGFRKLVFSVIIMTVVLFFSRGIMGDRELSFAGLAEKLRNRKKPADGAKGGSQNA